MRRVCGVLGNDRGFTMIEFVVAMTVLFVVIGAVVPAFVGVVRNMAGKTGAKEMRVVSEAALGYYLATKTMPADTASLASYLPGWAGLSKYGTAYSFAAVTGGTEIRALYPAEVAKTAARGLPFAWTEGAGSTLTLAMFLPRPARDPNLTDLQNRINDMLANPPIPVGTIILWDQSNTCPARFARVGAYDGMLLAGAASVGTGGGSHSHGISGHAHGGVPGHSHGFDFSPTTDVGNGCWDRLGQSWRCFGGPDNYSLSGHSHRFWGDTSWDGGGSTDGGWGGTSSSDSLPSYRSMLLCSFTG